MPKRIDEIKNFHAGIISTPDEADIPLDASPRSHNIEPLNVDGRLEGIPADVDIIDNVRIDSAEKINNNGIYHVVYYDSSDSKFKKIDDLHGTPASGTLSSSAESSVDTPVMALNNKEVHIGTGYQNKPKWAGFIENEQFEDDAPADMQIADAELVSPTSFGDIVKFVETSFNQTPTDQSYLFGVSVDGDKVYKFNPDTKELVGLSVSTFSKTKSLCISNDGKHLWVLDEINDKAVIHKVDYDEMIVVFSVEIASQNGMFYTDIHATANGQYRSVWVAETRYNTSDGYSNSNFLHWVNEDHLRASATSATLTNRTPNRNADGHNSGLPANINAGNWVRETDDEVDGFAGVEVEYRTPRICLTSVGGDGEKVGWLVSVRPADGNVVLRLRNQNSGNIALQSRVVNHGILVVDRESTTATKVEHFISLDSGNEFLGTTEIDDVDVPNRFYSISGTAILEGNPTIMITSGRADGFGDSTLYRLGTSGVTYTDIDWNSGLVVEVPISNAMKIDNLNLQSAYVSKHLYGNDISAFEGLGTGRWLFAEATGASEPSITEFTESDSIALETNANITFRETAVDYGAGGSANSKIGFTDSSTQFYKISFVYDGYQEGPLSEPFKFQGVSQSGRGVTVTVQLRNLATINRRVSHICLYRADADNRNPSVEEQGFYRLVQMAKLDVSWGEISGGSTIWSSYRQKIFIDNNTAGASFEARTGFSEVLKDITPNYSLSTVVNNTHFIANIKQDVLGHLSNYILKSKPLNFNQFNVAEDFIALPTTPTAIVGFNGRIYAFDENNTYRIEPNSFYVEDVYEGVGCMNQDCVVVTEYGLFFADKNNVYMHNGQQPQTIGDPILKGSDDNDDNENYGAQEYYHKLVAGGYAKMAWDGVRNAVLVIGEEFNAGYYSTYGYFCWAYSIKKGRWDKWGISDDNNVYDGSDKPLCFLAGKNGEVFFNNGSKLIHYMGDTVGNKRLWEWNSKELTGGFDGLTKSFIEVYVGGEPKTSPSSNVELYIDGASLVNNDNAQIKDKATGKKIAINQSHRKGKKLRITLRQQDAKVDSISIIYRPIGVTEANV